MDVISSIKRNAVREADGQQEERLLPGMLILAAILLVLALPPSNIWTMTLIVLGAMLAVVHPAMMISVVVVTVPIQEAVMLPYFRGDFTLTQIAVFGLFAGRGLTFWRYRIWLDSITFGYIAMGAAFLVSLLETDEFGLWVGEVYRWAIAAVFFLICRSVLRGWPEIRVVLWGLVAATMATWFHGFGQVIAGNGPEHMFEGGVLRVIGAFGTPNPLAAYVEFTIPLFLVLALLGFRRSFRAHIGTLLWAAAIATSASGMVILALTQSRGGMIGFAAAMVIVLWALPARLRLAAVGASVFLVLVVLLTPVGQSQLHRFERVLEAPRQSRTGEIYDYGFDRSSLWFAAIRMFEDEPLTGVGAGEFDYHYREYTPVWYDRVPLGQAHNGWLQMAAQAGLAGVIAFTAWITATLVSLIGATRRSTESLSRALAIGAFATMVAFSTHSLVDYLNVSSLGLQLGAIMAIGLSLAPDPLTAYVRSRPGADPQVLAGPLPTGLA